MKSDPTRHSASTMPTQRRSTNVTLPEPLLRQARDLRINVSKACERGLVVEVAKAAAQRWQEENRAAIEAWNAHFEQHGLPLTEFRQF